MRVVVGLGNPGAAYASSRHNVGFMVVERLAARWCVALVAEPVDACVGRGRVSGVSTLFVEPQGYMNRSGETLACFGEKWPVEDLIVVHDDLDLPPGRLKVRRDGGAGGHRGVESMMAHFGSGFDRLKVGIGQPPAGTETADYVLAAMSQMELAWWDSVLERASDALECWLVYGVERAMNRFNVRPDV